MYVSQLQGRALFEGEGGAGNPNPFGTKSLDFGGNDNDPNAKTVRLRDRLQEADTERRKAQDEADARERAAEIRREERLKKIAYMNEMPDSTPAGTGTCGRIQSLSRPSQNRTSTYILSHVALK